MAEPSRYDLFVFYADADRAWVEGYLFDSLEAAGVSYHSEAAFALGVPRLHEFERAIQQSQRTLLVCSPALLVDGFTQFTDLLAQNYGLKTGTWRVIPLILRPVELPPRLAVLTALDATDPSGHERVIKRLCDELGRPVPGPAPKPACPYPGMVPFREADSERFFGRDREVEELLQSLRLHRFWAVIGPSSSGKSSLVFAGLIPALCRSGLFGASQWLVRALRPGAKPLAALAEALGGDPADPGRAVAQALTAQPDTRHLLLVVDQFEELFTVAHTDAVAFQHALRRLAEMPNAYVIVTVGADFYPDLMGAPLWPEIKGHRVEVVPLDEGGLREAIIRPAKAVGVFVEKALVERLIADAAGEPGVLPLVQETLGLLWERLERRFLPLRAYEALASFYGSPKSSGGKRTGLQVAMASHADAALAALATPEQQAIARRIFLRLVHFGEGRADTRRQQTIAQLRVSGDDPVLFDQTLHHLTAHHLLTLSGNERAARQSVDLAHEALISGWPQLKFWLGERREAEQTRRRLEAKAAEWIRLGRGTGGLLYGDELLEAEQWLACPDAVELGYTDELSGLVRASRINQHFFNPFATVEVYLTEVLSDKEIGAYHFHLGDVRSQGIGADVHLVGTPRREGEGTVLRFQAPTYTEIYDVLPILLKPFRMSRAVDWAKTYESLPEHERDAMLTALARIEVGDPTKRWLFAERMAQAFGCFPVAQIKYIRDNRSLDIRGVRIEVAINQAIYEELAEPPCRSQLVTKQQIIYLPAGESPRIALESHSMDSEVTIGGNVVGSAVGSGSTVNARDINAFNNALDQSQGLDPELKRVLVEARQQLESGDLTGADKDDAVDDLGKLADEIKKPEPQPGRIKRFFDGIKQLAPDVASILSSAVKIGGLIKG